MRWVLLVAWLFFLWAASPVFCQPEELEQQGMLYPADTNMRSALISGNTEMFYGKPHLLVSQSLENFQLESFPFEEEKSDWKIFILLAGFSSLAFSRFFFSPRMAVFVKATTGNVAFNQMEREGGFFDETLTYLLFLNFLVVFSLLLWQTIVYFQLIPAHLFLNPFVLFAFLLVLATVFFLIKTLFLRFVAWVFDTKLSTTAYLKNLFLFNQLIGLVLIIPVAYLVYNPTSMGLQLTWMIWLLLNLFKMIRGASIGNTISAFPGYYLILYICSIELAPLLLIIKVGSKYFLTV